MYKFIIAGIILFVSNSALASTERYQFDFGLIIKNDAGEPVGFDSTTQIPLFDKDAESLYGLVVSRSDEEPFVLSAVHIFPEQHGSNNQKVMSKPMNIISRGAIFFQTDDMDILGHYQIEIYIDNLLVKTIDYKLVPQDT